jgi:hypothetical protein
MAPQTFALGGNRSLVVGALGATQSHSILRPFATRPVPFWNLREVRIHAHEW